MIQTITYNNPITNTEESFFIDIDVLLVNIDTWKADLYTLYVGNIYDKLNEYLNDLDCTRIYKSGRPMMIAYNSYKSTMAKFFKLLYKIPGYSIYNEYVDKLIQRHIDNILFEFNNPIIKSKPTNSKKQKSKPNKWIKSITNDLFTGEERYIYENLKTGEIITSGNPNLLEQLNNKKKDKPKISTTPIKEISINNLILNFKKK